MTQSPLAPPLLKRGCGALLKVSKELPLLGLNPKNAYLHNADVVKKFIFRYLSVPLTDGL
jgi:hypothetical protein